jgi:hypothetical protein
MERLGCGFLWLEMLVKNSRSDITGSMAKIIRGESTVNTAKEDGFTPPDIVYKSII